MCACLRAGETLNPCEPQSSLCYHLSHTCSHQQWTTGGPFACVSEPMSQSLYLLLKMHSLIYLRSTCLQRRIEVHSLYVWHYLSVPITRARPWNIWFVKRRMGMRKGTSPSDSASRESLRLRFLPPAASCVWGGENRPQAPSSTFTRV